MSAIETVKSTRKAAIFHAALGWPVIPIWPIRAGKCACGNPRCKSPGKHPIGEAAPNGVKDATVWLYTIQDWWDRFPDANIAIATGAPSGVYVIDIDPRHGGDVSWQMLIEAHGPIPDTVEVLTGGGGRHIYFEHMPGLGNTSGRLGPGIDTRGDGGYVLVPPSLHISGRRYEYELSSHAGDVHVAPMGDWQK